MVLLCHKDVFKLKCLQLLWVNVCFNTELCSLICPLRNAWWTRTVVTSSTVSMRSRTQSASPAYRLTWWAPSCSWWCLFLLLFVGLKLHLSVFLLQQWIKCLFLKVKANEKCCSDIIQLHVLRHRFKFMGHFCTCASYRLQWDKCPHSETMQNN